MITMLVKDQTAETHVLLFVCDYKQRHEGQKLSGTFFPLLMIIEKVGVLYSCLFWGCRPDP